MLLRHTPPTNIREICATFCKLINTATKYTNPLSPMTRIVEMGPKLVRHKELICATQDSAALPPRLKLLENESFRSLLQAQPPKTYIANQALEGFIESFRWSYPSFSVVNFMLTKPQQQPQCITERGLSSLDSTAVID